MLKIIKQDGNIRLVDLNVRRRFSTYEVQKKHWLFVWKWETVVFRKGGWGENDPGLDWFSDPEIANRCYEECRKENEKNNIRILQAKITLLAGKLRFNFKLNV